MVKKYKPKSRKCKVALANPRDFYELRIRDAMDKRAWDLPILEEDIELLDVFAVLCTSDHVWIVENKENNRVVGVITEHDILNALRPVKKHSFFGAPSRKGMGVSIFETADQIMSHDPVTCLESDKIEDVLHKMETHSVRRCAVVESKSNHKIMGEVTLHQLIRKYYKYVQPLCVTTDTSDDGTGNKKKK
jgi:predicted transcriptional regulator